MALSAISFGLRGTWGERSCVEPEPVTAQVMKTSRFMASGILFPPDAEFHLFITGGIDGCFCAELDVSMQIWSKSDSRTREIAFLLFDRFSNLALANLLEPLRATNTLLGREAYRWRIVTPDDEVAHTSSGLPIMPHGAFGRY